MPTDCAYLQRMASGMRAWFLVICPNSLPAPVAIRGLPKFPLLYSMHAELALMLSLSHTTESVQLKVDIYCAIN